MHPRLELNGPQLVEIEREREAEVDISRQLRGRHGVSRLSAGGLVDGGARPEGGHVEIFASPSALPLFLPLSPFPLPSASPSPAPTLLPAGFIGSDHNLTHNPSCHL